MKTKTSAAESAVCRLRLVEVSGAWVTTDCTSRCPALSVDEMSCAGESKLPQFGAAEDENATRLLQKRIDFYFASRAEIDMSVHHEWNYEARRHAGAIALAVLL